jgi:archaetidylinositol phosphate synthase
VIETSLRKTYQKICIDPLIRHRCMQKVHPLFLTCASGLLGVSIFPLLALGFPLYAGILLVLSGFLDTLDGSLARHYAKVSSKGAVLDIVSDRLVEFAIVLGLYCVESSTRALPALLMLGSILICVTSFLIVGVFTENNSEKSFHYSPGMIERAEAFIFFGIMMMIPSWFILLSYVFSTLVLITALIRVIQFLKRQH